MLSPPRRAHSLLTAAILPAEHKAKGCFKLVSASSAPHHYPMHQTPRQTHIISRLTFCRASRVIRYCAAGISSLLLIAQGSWDYKYNVLYIWVQYSCLLPRAINPRRNYPDRALFSLLAGNRKYYFQVEDPAELKECVLQYTSTLCLAVQYLYAFYWHTLPFLRVLHITSTNQHTRVK